MIGKRKYFRILLIQDNQGDIVLIQRAFNRLNLKNTIKINIITNGTQAFKAVINQQIKPIPDLVLLDLNLPGIGGIQILKKLKQSEKYRTIPVIMLTTSSRQQDIKQAYYNYANTYISKPIDWLQFQQAVVTLCKYWFDTTKLVENTDGSVL